MSDAKAVYQELRQPLLRTGALLVVLLLIMVSADWFNMQMNRIRQTAAQNFEGAVQDYRSAIASEQILRSDTQRFNALREQGFIGQEPRLRWVEDVRETAELTGVMKIRYELEPRHAQPNSEPTGIYQLFASTMKVQLDLRHEGDLLRFLDRLEARRNGLFELTACTLRRSHDSLETSLQAANVSADCELQWYSLDTPSTAPAGDAS